MAATSKRFMRNTVPRLGSNLLDCGESGERPRSASVIWLARNTRVWLELIGDHPHANIANACLALATDHRASHLLSPALGPVAEMFLNHSAAHHHQPH